jgi:arabinose-5-phosphate isomerase
LLDKKLIIDHAKTTLAIEAKAVENLINHLDDSFYRVVDLVHHSKGRLIVTGIGKSAVIAMKIVSSMNSTGTPAIFMHAADAIHGDLGIVLADDIVLCISKSGTSPEIKTLVPHIKNRGNKLIGMTANKTGYLGKESHYLLYTPVSKEACPNNLAPTASTTAQLAMGDALTVCLLKLKNFGEKDFAKHHPGGALGKKLYLTVGQMVNDNASPAVNPNTPVVEVIDEITTKRLGTTIVLSNKNIKGIVTDGDIRRMLKENQNINTLTAKDIMNPNPILVKENVLAVEALSILNNNAINHLVVVDEKKNYIGILHILDLIKEGING